MKAVFTSRVACLTNSSAVFFTFNIARLLPNVGVSQEITNTLQIGFLRVEFTSGYYQEDCIECGQVCPTGAIKLSTPEKKKSAPIRLAKFELEKRLLYHNRECSICRRECSYEAISFVWSEEEYLKIPTIETDAIDADYMNASFKKYLKSLASKNSEVVQDAENELHRRFATLSQEDQAIATRFLGDVQRGDVKSVPGKTFNDYLSRNIA